MGRTFLTVLALVVATSAIAPAPARALGNWDGHDFAFCFVTDDGTKCNLAWADTARVMDFRFTIAVNVHSGVLSPTKLSRQEIHDLGADGFEIAQHGASHGQAGLTPACTSPPRGSWMGYFLCNEPSESARMASLMNEIERDTIAGNCDLPASSVRVCAYPAHRHGKALIDSLIAEGFIGARTGGLWDYVNNSYGDFNFMASNSWNGGISLYRIPLANTDSYFFGNHSAVPPVHKTYEAFRTAAQATMNEFRASEGICVVYTHHLGDDNDTYGNINYGSGGITKQDLAWLIDLVRENNGKIMTLGDAVAYYRERSHAMDVNGDLVWMLGTTGVDAAGPAARVNLTAQPNPFNPRTVVSFDLATRGRAQVAIHDMRGRLVATLVDDVLDAGRHSQEWDGRDDAGEQVAAGTYLVRVRTAAGFESRTISLVK